MWQRSVVSDPRSVLNHLCDAGNNTVFYYCFRWNSTRTLLQLSMKVVLFWYNHLNTQWTKLLLLLRAYQAFKKVQLASDPQTERVNSNGFLRNNSKTFDVCVMMVRVSLKRGYFFNFGRFGSHAVNAINTNLTFILLAWRLVSFLLRNKGFRDLAYTLKS